MLFTTVPWITSDFHDIWSPAGAQHYLCRLPPRSRWAVYQHSNMRHGIARAFLCPGSVQSPLARPGFWSRRLRAQAVSLRSLHESSGLCVAKHCVLIFACYLYTAFQAIPGRREQILIPSWKGTGFDSQTLQPPCSPSPLHTLWWWRNLTLKKRLLSHFR